MRRVLGAGLLHVEARQAKSIGQSIGIRPVADVLGVLEIPLNRARCQPALARLAIRSQSPFPKIKHEGCGTPMHDWAPGHAPRACLMHWSR